MNNFQSDEEKEILEKPKRKKRTVKFRTQPEN